MARHAFVLFLPLSIALVGCDPVAPVADAGRDAPLADVGEAADTPIDDDAPAIDAPTSCLCDADQTCVRGVCIATCDGLDGIEAALVPGVIPVAHACRSAGPMDAVGADVFELVTEPAGPGVLLRLVRWTFADGEVTPTTVAQTTYILRVKPAETVYPGYVAVSDGSAHALIGYTTSLSGFQGGVVNIDVGEMSLTEIDADGNFDAAFVDGSRYLVNGLGYDSLEGQALYLADAADLGAVGVVANEMGDASGAVGLWAEEDIVIFGGARYGSTWPDGTMGGLTFAAPLDALLGAPTPLDAYADIAHVDGAPGVFEMLSRGRLLEVYYGASGIDGLRSTQLVVDGEGTVTAQAPIGVTLGGTFFNAAAIEDDVLLIHATGTLRVRIP